MKSCVWFSVVVYDFNIITSLSLCGYSSFISELLPLPIYYFQCILRISWNMENIE